jgi:hypothetical protein
MPIFSRIFGPKSFIFLLLYPLSLKCQSFLRINKIADCLSVYQINLTGFFKNIKLILKGVAESIRHRIRGWSGRHPIGLLIGGDP